MTQHNIPSRNPAHDNSMVGMLRVVLSKFLQQIDDMLPAVVIAAERGSPARAHVRPIISVVTTGGQKINRAPIVSIPVLQLGGGGFFASFPIKAGDLGWIKANDRDISLFKQSYSEASPNTKRKHSFEDALFIPDVMTGFTIAAEDQDNAVIQNLDGSVRLSWWDALLKATTPRMAVTDIEGYTPDANAILDIQSTTKAFMPPRMTQAQRNAIPNPHEGMLIWNTSTHGISVFNGSVWS